MSISSVSRNAMSTIAKATKKPLNMVAENKWIKKQLVEGETDPGRFTAKMLVLSIVTKDLVNCFLYTYQSWTNEKIPEKKRKFVAAVDAMNGLVMVGGQIFAGKVIDKKVAPWIKGLFTGTIKDDKNADINAGEKATNRVFHSDNIKNVVHTSMDELKKDITFDPKKVNLENVIKHINKQTKEPFVAGLGIIITTLATTAIVKRMMAPLISTPAAGYVNDKINQKSKAKKDAKPVQLETAAVANARFSQAPETKINKTV